MKKFIKYTVSVFAFTLLLVLIPDRSFAATQTMAVMTPTPRPNGDVYISTNDCPVSGNYHYEILSDNTVSIRRISNYGETVVIPKTIAGYPVSAIGFIGGDNISSISNLESIPNIEINNVFQPEYVGVFQENDTIVKKIIIPEGITKIGFRAMSGMKYLNFVEFPKSLSRIRMYAFSGCSALKELDFPKDIHLEGGFFGCTELKKVVLRTSNFASSSDDTALFSDCKIEDLIVNTDSKEIYIGGAIRNSTIQNVYVEKGVKKLILSSHAQISSITRLYIKDVKTKIIYSKKGDMSFAYNMKVNKIISIPGAKAISYAKKHKIPFAFGTSPTFTRTKKINTKAVPKSKTVKKGKTITLKAPKGTVLYYTTNGKKPTVNTKNKTKAGKSLKIVIRKKTKLRVIAVKSGYIASAEVKRTYKVY